MAIISHDSRTAVVETRFKLSPMLLRKHSFVVQPTYKVTAPSSAAIEPLRTLGALPLIVSQREAEILAN
jgi:hypothetical protein